MLDQTVCMLDSHDVSSRPCPSGTSVPQRLLRL